MNMKITKVLKFGGSSVATAETIDKVIAIILKEKKAGNTILAVFSAFGKTKDRQGTTDLLLQLADKASLGIDYTDVLALVKTIHLDIINGLFNDVDSIKKTVLTYFDFQFSNLESTLKGISLVKEKSDKSIAQIVSFGETTTSFIIANKFKAIHEETILVPSAKLIKTTENNYLNAVVDVEATSKNLITFIEENNNSIYIAAGFIATNSKGEPTTLGRGGSDYTASLFAAILAVKQLEIWTDVSGMYTCNPSIVKKAMPIAELSYKEAMELSYFGAKVLYAPTLRPVLENKIPLIIKNTFKPDDAGTRIEKDNANYKYPIRGISNINNVSLLNVEGAAMVGVPGFSARVFDALAKSNINIILITQASSEHAITFAVKDEDVAFASEVLNKEFELEIQTKRLNPITIDSGLAIIAVVGSQMKNHKGIASKIFKALANNKINIRAIAQGSSERNISLVIKKNDVNLALQKLHAAFFENPHKTINMFIIGTGNIGKTLLKQMIKQDDWIYDEKHIDLNIFALANSHEMIFDYGGIRISKMPKSAKHAEPMNIDKFIEKTIALGYPNSVLVDNTASRDVALNYHRFLENGISVVTCNKIAFSEDYSYYKKLRKLAVDNGAYLRYETTVGAALPIIKTIRNIIYSGDEITKIEGIFSGSLNYIFSTYDTSVSFATVVKQAQKKGYTEPDPRIDLSGIDVLRKMLIVARESENELEQRHVDLVHFLPTNCVGTLTVEKFYEALEKEENYFKQLYNKAKVTGSRLKFVSVFEKGKIEDVKKIELQRINNRHPLYNIQDTDNSILIYTKRYGNKPLWISGAGAGKEVTAMGVFSDIINIANNG